MARFWTDRAILSRIWHDLPIFYKIGPDLTKFLHIGPYLARLGDVFQVPVIFGGVWKYLPGLARYEAIRRYLAIFYEILHDFDMRWH